MMTFINRYTKPDAFNYYYSEQFYEYGNSFVLAIGKTKNEGLITKVNLSGNIIWEKTFNAEGSSSFECKKIIQIEDLTSELKTIYVLNVVIDNINSLMAIDASSGEIMWTKLLNWKDSDAICNLVTTKEETSFYVVISDRSETDYSINPILYKFDYNGEVINTIEVVHGKPLLITSIVADNDRIAIAGRVILENSTGIIISFNKDLKYIDTILIDKIFCNIHDFKIIPERGYLLSGYSINDKAVFITKILYEEEVVDYKILVNTQNCGSHIEITNDIIYLVHYNEQMGYVHKLDFNLNALWTKTIEIAPSTNNGIRFIKEKNNRLTSLFFNQTEGSLIVNSNTNLDTCKTKELTTILLNSSKIYLKTIEVAIKQVSHRPEDIEASEKTITSQIKQYCNNTSIDGQIVISKNISLQSPNFILNVAGSTAQDGSTKGIHLRWFFGGILGEKHLPKGDYYTSGNFIFNKPNDYVSIYRAKYSPVITTIDFSLPPNVVNPAQRFWIYKIAEKLIYVYFKNTAQYDSVANEIDPLTQTYSFIEAYGGNLIEIESKKDLFFGSSFEFSNVIQTSQILTETLSVEKNLQLAPKITSSRGKYGSNDFGNLKIFNDNCKSIRFKTSACLVVKIHLEFYADFIFSKNASQSWYPLGKYALSLDDTKVLAQLEPTSGLVNSKWPRFNDGENVNINNYIDKWNGTIQDDDRNIKEVVAKFLALSTDSNNPNPTGIETINFNLNIENEDGTTPPVSEDDFTSLPLLDILNVGALDYHVARMLGLGILDINAIVLTGEKYVYLSEYTTFGDLEDGLGKRELQHISMSLPTSIYDERLPLPYELNQIVPGIVTQNDEEIPVMMTDNEGYTPDGKYRFVTLESNPLPEELVNIPFYDTSELFNQSEFSYAVSAGLEYKMNNQQNWVKPELSHDINYRNIFQGNLGTNETIPLMLPEQNNVLYIHKQSDSGTYNYLTYGINIFSRSTIGNDILSINTIIRPQNQLQPPHNINALLIREESPLLLTSEEEQDRIGTISNTDKTLVRLTFDYHTNQELTNYQIEEKYNDIAITTIESETLNGEPNYIYPDEKDIFAEEVEVFFRNQTPNVIEGKIISQNNDPINELVVTLNTGVFNQSSTGLNLSPLIPQGKENNFIGGKVLMGTNAYFIYQIENTSTYPTLKVLKNSELDDIVIVEDGYFQLVENMQNITSWNTPFNTINSLANPFVFKIQLGLPNNPNWQLKREVIHLIDEEGNTTRFLEKTKGFWKNAIIEEIAEPVNEIEQADGTYLYANEFNGLYKLTFTGFQLNQHPQFSGNNNSVEWFRGLVRLRTEASHLITGERKSLEVIRIENIGTGDLVLYIYDNNYPGYNADQNILDAYDKLKTGTQLVNYYPSYKVYLYQNQAVNLTESKILPQQGEGNKYSIFGLRSHDLSIGFTDYYSKISIPALLFAQEIVAPIKPQTPLGAKYATRPDFYGKSTYTFTTAFGSNANHKPHGLQFLRSNDDSIINALYDIDTVKNIRQNLKIYGGNDEVWLKNRWDNFFDFESYRSAQSNGLYMEYPENEIEKYRLPIPNNPTFISSVNDFIKWHNKNNGSNSDASLVNQFSALNQVIIATTSGVQYDILLIDFVEQTVKNSFIPLTEIPILYDYIKPNTIYPNNYKPIYKKQNVRDSNGYMLNPDHPDFDIAPMAKRVSQNSNEVQFTDFTIDGTSKNIYFYSVREIGNQMKMGEMSDILGPIKLVNTNSPEAPEIKRIIPILENRILGINACVKLEINRYPEEQFIKKINLYRSFNRLEAQSIRTMQLIKTIDLEIENLEIEDIWNFVDDFSDLVEVPYGDPLFYRITVSRKVEYSEDNSNAVIEYVPSNPSKLLATTVVENYMPESPLMSCYSEQEENGYVNFITLKWNKTCYNGIYHLYKLNQQGNWIKIHEVASNEETIFVQLEETKLNSANLRVLSSEGDKLYHHFKVITENTSGMFSTKENILTIFNEETWNQVGGIGEMITGSTFRVR
ncbi:hypothetical protein LXD69_09660 [Flavobacterium sediminilitoris]|uniref:Uncharacterized protein n=1 Tax=Flavobacterium sediminilitoris TaxID=2024526 RepID=A0ABY4HIB7_9FLAO|nr:MULTISPECIES: hypothetical protein [Flavobacterium]UOX32318.1 hypothetical protein LXD69_09660 [Flavobacterium sediminilitoris]